MSIVISDEIIVRRGRKFALRVGSLEVSDGKTLGVIGPNGSGKTTFVEMLAGALTPESGNIRMSGGNGGKSLRPTTAIMGFIPDSREPLANQLSAHKYFSLLQRFYKAVCDNDTNRHIRELAALLGFNHFYTPIGQLSRGEQQKVRIIAGLLHNPSIILADEPHSGLDALGVAAFDKELLRAVARGTSAVVATNDLVWAEKIADTTLVLVGGNVALNAPTKVLVQKYGSLEATLTSLLGKPPT